MIYNEQEIDNFLDTEPDRGEIKLFCHHYAVSYFRFKNSEKASLGGRAYWSKITPEQKAEHIRKMTKGRVDKSKNASK
jgi:ABC-type transporter MlaC component